MSIPTLTAAQRSAGTAQAIRSRRQRADVKQAIAHGFIRIDEALLMDDTRNILVRDLLLAAPGIGATTADQLMAKAKVSPRRRVGGLGSRQREALLRLLGVDKK